MFPSDARAGNIGKAMLDTETENFYADEIVVPDGIGNYITDRFRWQKCHQLDDSDFQKMDLLNGVCSIRAQHWFV